MFANFGSHNSDCRLATDEYPESKFPQPCFVLGRHGVMATRSAIEKIVDDEGIDCIVVVDGGVDSLMIGDEENQGTILEDFIVLAAANQIDVAYKYLACVGLGTESEEDLNHFRVLENISNLAKDGGFLGSCS